MMENVETALQDLDGSLRLQSGRTKTFVRREFLPKTSYRRNPESSTPSENWFWGWAGTYHELYVSSQLFAPALFKD